MKEKLVAYIDKMYENYDAMVICFAGRHFMTTDILRQYTVEQYETSMQIIGEDTYCKIKYNEISNMFETGEGSLLLSFDGYTIEISGM